MKTKYRGEKSGAELAAMNGRSWPNGILKVMDNSNILISLSKGCKPPNRVLRTCHTLRCSSHLRPYTVQLNLNLWENRASVKITGTYRTFPTWTCQTRWDSDQIQAQTPKVESTAKRKHQRADPWSSISLWLRTKWLEWSTLRQSGSSPKLIIGLCL